ncbi:hypothetical protein [Acaryochloris sp. IP29b_bin.148]|uniref:hypothetical protein n=1 Tax=Acaryochloris sp. IP29b_bin.148 TaxID=2969218 RepID=UPI00260654D2|nr:hypothetical protein [Acaryochloris sp. IP29b_bin.148]
MTGYVEAAGLAIDFISGQKGDISYNLPQMKGLKYPYNDAKKFGNRTGYEPNSFDVKGRMVLKRFLPFIPPYPYTSYLSAEFEVSYEYNGSSIGNVSIELIDEDDVLGYGIHIDALIKDDNKVYETYINEYIAAIYIKFNFKFTSPIYDSCIKRITYHLYADGDVTDSGWKSNNAFMCLQDIAYGR